MPEWKRLFGAVMLKVLSLPRELSMFIQQSTRVILSN